MGNLILTSSGGSLFSYDILTSEISEIFRVGEYNEYLMGITKSDDTFYFSSNYTIYKLSENIADYYTLSDKIGNVMIQHIKCIGNYIFVPVKTKNSILILSKDLSTISNLIVFSPSSIETFGDNISNITFDGEKFIVQFTTVRESGDITREGNKSGVILLDTDLNIISRETNGRGVVLTECVDGNVYLLCNYMDENRGCLSVNGEAKVIWNRNYHMYDLAILEDSIFIVGKAFYGNIFGGVIVHLDKNFNVINNTIINNVGYFMGCSCKEDRTNLHYISDKDINIDNWRSKKEDNIIVMVQENGNRI